MTATSNEGSGTAVVFTSMPRATGWCTTANGTMGSDTDRDCSALPTARSTRDSSYERGSTALDLWSGQTGLSTMESGRSTSGMGKGLSCTQTAVSSGGGSIGTKRPVLGPLLLSTGVATKAIGRTTKWWARKEGTPCSRDPLTKIGCISGCSV
ncbi:unnamed protein product, partial [Hapterophycus canaliculatus]